MLNRREENKQSYPVTSPRFSCIKDHLTKNSCEPEIAAFEPRKSVASCRVQGTCVDGRLQSDNKATTSVGWIEIKVLLLLRTFDFLAVLNTLEFLP